MPQHILFSYMCFETSSYGTVSISEKPEPMIVEYLEHRTPPQVKNCPQPMEWTTFRPRVIDTPFTMPKFHQKSQDKFTQPVPPRSPRRGSEQG